MKLQVPFVQLPLLFDAERLFAEIDALGESVWRPHPQGYKGNSALPLISVDGDPASDSISGRMLPTPHLDACPYLKQVLSTIGAVWGRSRLMRLSGHAEVPQHADLAYYWREHMRVHVPIQTQPSVRFLCGEAEVNMAAGECWIFDTWRPHRVINANDSQRIHLVADTVGSERFWELASGGRVPGGAPMQGWQPMRVEPGLSAAGEPIYESVNLPVVMTPWELREHLGFLVAESHPHPQLAAVQQASARLTAVWLSLWARYGTDREGWPAYRAVLDAFADEARRVAQPIMLRNGSPFLMALAPMILRAALADGPGTPGGGPRANDPDAGAQGTSAAPAAVVREIGPRRPASVATDARFDRSIFIVSPPRSGSTLLFETLARAPDLYTIGGESHGRVEGLPELHPAARGFESNRLDAEAATPAVVAELRARFDEALRDRAGRTPPAGRIRMLEKTPKNALRIPFLRRAFPEACFIYLYRDPREVLSSMIEAWSSGRFRTYPNLPGWNGPDWNGPDWSLALVPGWRALRGRPLPEIVAGQWRALTEVLLDDLADVPAERVAPLRYDVLLADPHAAMRDLCARLDLRWNDELPAQLPNSRHTVSAPASGKWRRHEREIEAVLPTIAAVAARAERMAGAPMPVTALGQAASS